MKRLTLILAACSVVLFTAGRCAAPSNGGDEGDTVEEVNGNPPTASELVMVYSKSYDGFLTIREQPDLKAPAIGRILNGPMGAVKMGEIGDWTIVKVGETIGYASSRYLQSTPTPEFTDEDMEKYLTGKIWTNNTRQDQRQIMLFPDGLFMEGYTLEGICFCGTWSVKGNILALRKMRVYIEGTGWEEQYLDENWTIESGDRIIDSNDEPMKKVKLMSQKDYNDKESIGNEMKWYEVDEYNFTVLYESAYLAVNGSYPPGN